jgi:hypothetical protein
MNAALIVVRSKLGHQREFGGAFAEGLERHGWRVEFATDYRKADLVVMWGVRRGDRMARAKADGCKVCILERGYLGDRFEWTSVSFGGGLNGRAEFRGPFGDPSRWNKNFADLMRDYDPPKDGYGLIMGQVPGDMSIKHANIDQWYGQTAKALEKIGWSVRFRPHPLAGRRSGNRRAGHLKEASGTLCEALRGAGVVVTFNSNSGVDAALCGRPVIAFDPGSMVYEIAGHQVDEIREPDRTAWAHALAWKQWTRDEMASGECWGAISDG